MKKIENIVSFFSVTLYSSDQKWKFNIKMMITVMSGISVQTDMFRGGDDAEYRRWFYFSSKKSLFVKDSAF